MESIGSIKECVDKHKVNSYILSIIYYGLSVFAIVLSTTVSLLLGSKSVNRIQDKVTLVCFIFNLTSTIVLSVINFLRLESKISDHKHTIKEIEELIIDINESENDIHDDVIREKIKMINSHAPDLCF